MGPSGAAGRGGHYETLSCQYAGHLCRKENPAKSAGADADTHAGAYFITPANPAFTVSSFNANNLARVDLSPIGGKFVCVKRTKGANAVSAKVKITRLS